MGLFKRRSVTGFFSILLLGVLYVSSRLVNLTKLPVFTDEAIYIRWSQIGSHDANWRFISLTDGKQPMFTWIMMIALRFIRDPLFAGRFVSVLAGAGSIIGIWFLAYELFQSKRIAFLSSFFYLIVPFSLLYDRMALYDSLVATFSIWNLYISIRLVREPRLDTALILGMTLGAGMLNKSSGFLSLYLLPLTLFLFDFHSSKLLSRFYRWVSLALLAVVLSQVFYSVLRLSPFAHMIKQKDLVFLYAPKEWVVHPFRFFIGNSKGLFDWLIHYLTKPLFFVSLLPLITLYRKPSSKLLLYAWCFIPFVGLALFGKVLYPRFILFMTMPLLILIAWVSDWWIRHFSKKIFGIVAMVTILIPSLYTDYFIMMEPRFAPIPRSDKGQFIDDWPSGGGVREINAFFLEQSHKSAISIYTEGTFGLMPYAIEMYLVDKPNIKIKGIWPLPETIPPEILNDAKQHPTYMVLNETQEIPAWPMHLLAAYQKGNRTDRKLHLFQVIPPSSAL